MIQRSGAELSVEGFGSEAAEVADGEGPEVEHVVPGEGFPLLHQHHLGPQEGQLDGRSEPAGPGAQHQNLGQERGGWEPAQATQGALGLGLNETGSHLKPDMIIFTGG